MNKIAFKIDDSIRCLLTEVLPYETPIIFSNDHFYSVIQRQKSSDFPGQLKDFLGKFASPKIDAYRIPFDYKINKSGGSGELTLSVMHPASQTAFVDFYHTYSAMIISLCQRSEFSLRYPAQLHNSRVLDVAQPTSPLRGDPVDADDNAEIEGDNAEDDGEDFLYPSSYFIYKKYNLIHKFYDSYEFQRLEKRFDYLKRFDISKCFYNIYTHSIAWAVKDKKFSKKNIKSEGFEARFDKLMQLSNYNETNGIVVGPEVSRIFAEIILQRIDVDVEVELRSQNLFAKRDYDVRRYVDDYFVFSTKGEVSEAVFNMYKEKLARYKLYINSNKTVDHATPYITGLTLAKLKVRDTMSDLFKNFYDNDEREEKTIRALQKPSQLSRNTIQKIKASAHECQVPFEHLSSFSLTLIRRRLGTLCKLLVNCKERGSQERAVSVISVIIDILSYIVAADLRVRTTYIISQVSVMMKQSVSDFFPDISASVCTRLSEELVLLIAKSGPNLSSLERLNLLIAINEISPKHLKNDAVIVSYFSAVEKECSRDDSDDIVEECGINYFALISILYCIKADNGFSALRNSLVAITEKWMRCTEWPLFRSDLIMALLDLMSCPYIEKRDKARLLSTALEGHRDSGSYSSQKISEHVKLLSQYKWFVDWSNVSVERLLRKKELRPPYES